MKTKFNEAKVGDKFSETQYYTVVKKTVDKAQLKNSLGQDIVVDKAYIEDCLTSGNQFEKEEKINKTDLAALFLKNANVVFTVSFNKQVKPEDVTKEILSAYEGSTPKSIEAAIKKAVKRGLEGEERILVGYHSGTQDDFGRVQAVDMNITEGHNIRQVDPRQLNYLVVRGIKYTLK